MSSVGQIEKKGRMGTGTGDMIERCRSPGLPEPAFALTDGFVATLRRRPGRAYETVAGAVTGEVTGEVAGEVTGEVAKLLGLGAMEMTIPDKLNSRSQKYRLTNKGRGLLRALQSGRKKP